MKSKAVITSISGTKLKKNEADLFRKYKPWGIILFKRNISSFNQLKSLIKSIKKVTRDKKYPILIDEEGGSVSRMSRLFNNNVYSQKFFADIYNSDKKIGIFLYKNYISSICSIFKLLGININTVPVLDILRKNTHGIIGSRSYSSNKKTIINLGKLCVKFYKKNKIGTTIKHIPGHGGASVDSHKNLPIVNIKKRELNSMDFSCFKNINSFFAMTAHIIYKSLDSKNTCTHSKIIIKKIIRKRIGFKGILISDDLSMKALKYDLLTNARKSLSAGCNLVLYCSGKYKDSRKLLKELPLIDSFTAKKTSEFYKFLS
tara:strand:- start:8840 stop:9787 length:948 start_codon:yes stop_codon:yes gene_type:complete